MADTTNNAAAETLEVLAPGSQAPQAAAKPAARSKFPAMFRRKKPAAEAAPQTVASPSPSIAPAAKSPVTPGPEDLAHLEVATKVWKSSGFNNLQAEGGVMNIKTDDAHVKVHKDKISFHGPTVPSDKTYAAAMQTAKQMWGGEITLNPGTSAKENMRAWAHAQAAGVKVNGYEPPKEQMQEAVRMAEQLKAKQAAEPAAVAPMAAQAPAQPVATRPVATQPAAPQPRASQATPPSARVVSDAEVRAARQSMPQAAHQMQTQVHGGMGHVVQFNGARTITPANVAETPRTSSPAAKGSKNKPGIITAAVQHAVTSVVSRAQDAKHAYIGTQQGGAKYRADRIAGFKAAKPAAPDDSQTLSKRAGRLLGQFKAAINHQRDHLVDLTQKKQAKLGERHLAEEHRAVIAETLEQHKTNPNAPESVGSLLRRAMGTTGAAIGSSVTVNAQKFADKIEHAAHGVALAGEHMVHKATTQVKAVGEAVHSAATGVVRNAPDLPAPAAPPTAPASTAPRARPPQARAGV